ncbi:MAG: glycoside hydrolase family 38 C-terminal domain-containing protein, partial [Promethearchaeota archaeon]
NKVFVQGISRISDTWHAIKERQLTPIQLYLNGSDHKEAELDLPEFVEFFNNEEDIQEELNLELKHSTLENYFEDLEKFITENGLKIPTLTGEWRGSMYTQVTPACISTRMYLKQENFQSQMQLEKYSEPLSAIAKFMGGTYDTDMLWESWRWLIKNHPHDSICGCSIDRVHDDMETRFCWSQDVSKDMMYKALSQIALGINDKKILDKIKAKNQISIQKYITLIMFNPNLSPNSVESVAEELISINYNFDYRLFDEDGNEISDFIIEKIKDYRDLPQAQYLYKRFHGNYSVGKVSIFDNSKSIGYKTYMLCGVSKSSQKSEGSKTINNGYLTFEELPKKEFRGKNIIVTLNKNGSFNIKDLKSNKVFNNLNILEDMADDGDEYDYSPLKDEMPILSKDLNAKFRILDDNKLRSVIEIAIDFYVPKDLLNDGPRGALERKRNPDKIKLQIICELTIYSNQDVVRIKLKLNNQAKSHRLRALFPTGIQSNCSFADDHFMVMKRTIELPRDDGWYQDMQGLYHNDTWVDICNEEYGLAVFNKGLPEFEIVDRTKFGLEGNTIALTLFRSVGWMSKAGHLGRKSGTNGPNIPTPGAQCLRYFEFEYAVFPHEDSWEKGGVYEHAYSYCYPPVIFDKNQAQNFRVDILKDLPASCSIIGAENENIQLTSLKFSEPDLASKEGVIARFFNANTKEVDAKFYIHPEFKKVYKANLLEEVIEELNLINDKPDNQQKSLKIKMRPNEILTLLLTF